MKRIVIDARESGTSTGRYVDKLIEYLYRLKPAYEIVVLTRPDRVEFVQKIAPKFQVVPSRIKEFTFAEQTVLLQQVRKLKPDLMHFAMVQQPILYWGRVVTTMHDLTTARFTNPAKNFFIFKFKQFVYKWVNIIAARKSAAIITPTEYVKGDVARFARINSRKITVTLESADLITEVAEPVEALQDKQFIMYIGRPQTHKNLNRLIESFNILKQSHPELMLALAGKKDTLYEQIANKLKRGAGDSGVLQTGYVTEGQLRWMYEHTAAYVVPSLSEGFGLPGLEAMIHGTPVASSDATCLPEVYQDGVLYFNPQDTEDMAAKIGQIIDSPALRQELIQKGKKVASKYSWERMAQQTLAVYDEVLSK